MQTATGTVVATENLTRSFGTRRAVDGVTLSVGSGDAELLLPMLALPFFVPIVIPAAQATAKLMSGRPVGDAVAWLKLLVAFDIVFVVACALAYPFTLEE